MSTDQTLHNGRLPRTETLTWVERLVSIDTTSRDSNLPLIELVAEHCRGLGLQPHVLPSQDGVKANLVVTVPAADGTTTGGVMLSGHSDVVPVDGQDWQSDPFTAVVKDGLLYGRGTCDMKGFLGVCIAALVQMTSAGLREPVHLALSYDEEVGCLGAYPLVKDIAELGIMPRACIVGEPSSMRVITGHKSINVMKVIFTGVAAHSSLTAEGVNAIEYAGLLVRWVRELADHWRDEGPWDEAYPLKWSTASVNQIEGGTAVNIVPEQCSVTFEFRTIAQVDPEQVQSILREFCADLDRQMKAENPAAGVEVTVVAATPGLETPSDADAVTLGAVLGGAPWDGKVTYGTEAGIFASAGIETIVCGPGDIAQAHKPNEFVSLEQLATCEQVIDTLIAHLSKDPS